MEPSRNEAEPARRPILASSCWAGLFILYEVPAGSPSWPEAIAGGLASLAATAAVLASGRPEYLGRMRWSWWWLLLRRLPSQVIRDLFQVLRASVVPSRLVGRFRSVAFDPGGDDVVSGSRRALVVFGASVAPNTYVVAIHRERNALLTHQFVPGGPSPGRGDPQWPI